MKTAFREVGHRRRDQLGGHDNKTEERLGCISLGGSIQDGKYWSDYRCILNVALRDVSDVECETRRNQRCVQGFWLTGGGTELSGTEKYKSEDGVSVLGKTKSSV